MLALALLAQPACSPGDRTASGSGDRVHDRVVLGGRVMDPESGLDAIRAVGISDGRVAEVATGSLVGRDTVDASGLVVAPGFVDLHAHGQDLENHRLFALDGVTTALELESGAARVSDWYGERDGSIVNYGVAVGHNPVRMEVMDDPGPNLPSGPAAHRTASDAELASIVERMERGLEEGALAVGLQIQNTPAATKAEIVDLFRVAARHGASVHVHLRSMGGRTAHGAVESLEEVLEASATTGAPLHVLHVHSMGLDVTDRLLEMIAAARERGLDVTTEAYPYTAGMTGIESAVFDPGWQERMGIGYADLEWADTGERLDEAGFRRHRARGGYVIVHFVPEAMMEAAIRSPLAMIVSDGRLQGGKGHPRTSGAFARVLGTFVRERGDLTLMEALRKMTVMPARRLEARVPEMARKGRVRVGADADLTGFDPEVVADRSTYADPARPPAGIVHVLVAGEPVVRGGRLVEGARPGRPIRAPVAPGEAT